MEPTYYNRFTHWLSHIVGKVACKFGDHTYSWKLERGETIQLSGPPPNRATCKHCGKRYKDETK